MILRLFPFIFLASCTLKSQPPETEYRLIRSAQAHTSVERVQRVKFRGLECLMLYSQRKAIEFIDWEADTLVHRIAFPKLSEAFYSGVYYHNEDSIFISVNPARHPRYLHDSSLFLLNGKGQIQRSISYVGLPVWHSENKDWLMQDICYVSPIYTKLWYHQQRIFVPLSRYASFHNQPYFDSVPHPTLAFIQIDHDGGNYCDTGYVLPLRYESPSGLKKQPDRYMVRSKESPRFVLDQRGNPLVLLSHSPKFYYYDFASDKVETWTLKTRFLDSLYMVLYPDVMTAPQYDYREPEFVDLDYNPEGDYFVCFIRLPSQQSRLPYGELRYAMLAFKRGGEVLADVLLDQGLSPYHVFFRGNDMFILDYESSRLSTEKAIYFRILKILDQ